MFSKYFKGFSLVELMISLITISLISAAFMPIVTKKLSSSTVKIGKSISSVRSDCEKFEENGGKCNACFDSFCLLCDIFCTQNQYKNVGECKCENCSERSEGCLKCSSKGCDTCKAGYYVDSSGNCVKCPKGAKCDGVNKVLCPKGFYQDEASKSECKPCLTDDGKYAPSEGLTACSSCSAGQYTVDINWDWNWDGNSHYGVACANCPVGWGCPDGKRPTQCANNQYQDTTGQTSCKACSTGTYSPNSPSEKCSACDLTCTSCWADVNNCTGCKSGYYLSSNTCTLCPTNATCDGSSDWSCNTYFTKYSNTCTRTSCPANQYLSGQTCVTCPANATCNGSSDWWCNTYFTKSGTSCTRSSCPTNQYLSGQTCLACPDNAVCNGSGNYGCESGYTLESGQCVEDTPTFTYTGAYTQSETTSEIRVFFKSSGTFTGNFSKTVSLIVIGGGGGAGSGSGSSSICYRNYGYGGCGGDIQTSDFSVKRNTGYSVTIGGGGDGAKGCWNVTECYSGSGGNSSKFGNISASGGGGGLPCTYQSSQSCSQSSKAYYGTTYSVKGGGNTNNTGNGGKDTTGSGQAGASGIVIMVIPK